MRVYQQYQFQLGKKKFSEAFLYVDRFLETNGLYYQALTYDFADYDFTDSFDIWIQESSNPRQAGELMRRKAKISACHQMSAKLPWLGEPQYQEYITPNGQIGTGKFYLSSQDELGNPLADAPDEALVRKLASKFPRPFNPNFASFTFLNIDFFGRQTPLVEESIDAFRSREKTRCSHITISRTEAETFSLILTLNVDVTGGEQILDASDYVEAMARIIGTAKYTSDQILVLDEEEKNSIIEQKRLADPIVREARAYIQSIDPGFFAIRDQYLSHPAGGRLTFGKLLKSMGKRYGYGDYLHAHSTCWVRKRVSKGHWCQIELHYGISRMELSAQLYGPGFYLDLPVDGASPICQEELNDRIHLAFETVEHLKEHYFERIGGLFDPTPEWYCPNPDTLFSRW